MLALAKTHIGGLIQPHNDRALTVFECTGKNNDGKLDAWIEYDLRNMATDEIISGKINGKAFVYIMDIQLKAIEAGTETANDALIDAVMQVAI